MSKRIFKKRKEIKLTIYVFTEKSYSTWCVCMLSCVRLDPTDCSLPGSSVHGIFLARILEWVAISSSRGSSWPRDRPSASWGSAFAHSYLILCDPVDSNPPFSSIHGILQARILESVARPSSRGSSQPRDRTHDCLPLPCYRWILYHWATWEALWTFSPPFKFMLNS